MFRLVQNIMFLLVLLLTGVSGQECTTHCDCADNEWCDFVHECIDSCATCDIEAMYSSDWCCPVCGAARSCDPPTCCDATEDSTCHTPFLEDCATWYCNTITDPTYNTLEELYYEFDEHEFVEAFIYSTAFRLNNGNYECYSLDGKNCEEICPIVPSDEGIPVVCNMYNYIDRFHWCNHAVQTCNDGGAGIGTERCIMETGRWSSNLIDFHTNVPDFEACRSICVTHPKCSKFSFKENRGQCKTHTSSAHFRQPREEMKGYGHVKWVRNSDFNGCSPDVNMCPEYDCNESLCTEGCEECIDDRSHPMRSVCECFGASARVTVLSSDGNQKAIRVGELKIGDKVLSFDDNGNLVFDEVYYIYHNTPWTLSKDKQALVNIAHEGGSIPIAGIHLIYLTKTNGQTSDHCIHIQNTTVCTFPANLAEIGDVIWVLDSDGVFEPKTITSLSELYDHFRSPVTLHGNIIVENVAASVYIAHKTQCEGSILPLRILNSFEATRGMLGSEIFQFLWESFHISAWRVLRDYEMAGNAMEIGTENVTVIISVIIGTVIIMQMYLKNQ